MFVKNLRTLIKQSDLKVRSSGVDIFDVDDVACNQEVCGICLSTTWNKRDGVCVSKNKGKARF